MDLKEDDIHNVKSENVHHRGCISDNPVLNTINPHLPLTDINNINPRESIHSLEKAQQIWIENSKSWLVKDELQNAQIQWIKDFSSDSKFLCTSTPQPKRKEVKQTLPWTPPKTAADVCPRRGVCVYKPGSSTVSGSSFVAEKGNSVKIARLEEPIKVSPLKKHQDENSKHQFSSFPDSDVHDERKPPKKCYITVRKKLERLKKPVNEGDQDKPNKEKTGPSPDKRDEEKREATRQFMLRKRAEREREIEIQRRKEAKAEAEKKARMERLRETQQRLMKNALKRQTPEKKPISREDSPEPLWEDSPAKLVSRKTLVSPNKASLVKTPSRTLSLDKSDLAQETNDMKAVDDPLISELLLNSDIPTQKKMALLDRLEEGALTGKDSILDIMTSKEYLALMEMSPTPDLSKTSSFSSRISVKSQSPSKVYDFSKAESITNCSVFENSATSLASTSKGSINVLEYIKRNSSQNITHPEQLSKISSSWQGEERSYNILRAVSNKHAAFELFEKENTKDFVDGTQRAYASGISRSFLSNDLQQLNNAETKPKVLSEKGIQCKVEDSFISSNPDRSSEFVGSSSIETSRVHFTQSERLQKPNIVLTPGRSSDPCFYQSQKFFNSELTGKQSHSQLKYGDEGFFDNLIETDIDPPIDPTESREVVKTDLVPTEYGPLEYRVSATTKGRSQGTVIQNKMHIEPLQLPKDCNLSSNKADHLNIKKHEEIPHLDSNSIMVSSHLDISKTLNLNNSVLDDVQKKLSISSSVIMNSSQLNEVLGSNRDKRIEEEIRKLESFNDSITSKLEMNKSFIYENDVPQKVPSDEVLLERTATSSTINNELSQENAAIRGSRSSSSFDAQSEDVSGTSIAKFSLNMFNELLKDEEARNVHQTSLFKMKEKALTDKTKAELAFLEIEKKKFKEMGNEEGVRNIRKKIRGLALKLSHDLTELQRVRKTEYLESRKRRQKLIEKINLIKVQLKAQSEIQKGGSSTKEGFKVPSNASTETKKTHALLEIERRELEQRENVLKERLAELENMSSWKQRLVEGEKRIQELEARLKMALNTKGKEKDKLVERGTSPCRLTSDESLYEGRKPGGSYSDTFDQASSSSAHEKLDSKSTRKTMAIKVPLSPLLTSKRRHSSGSDESLMHSQTETQSEASDMEVRVLALEQQLKQRKAKLESLHREHKKSQKERLIAKEQSLLSQIHAYDLYIEQIKKDLEKEKEIGNIKIVKPLIKQPRIQSDRRKSDTWLIQDRKNKADATKDSLQSPYAHGVGGDSISNILLKDKQDNRGKNARDKHSMKPEILVRGSQSDLSNIINSSDERTGQSKLSYSSTESYESDIDKVKMSQTSSNVIQQQHSVISSDNSLIQPLSDICGDKKIVDVGNENKIGAVNRIVENAHGLAPIVADEKDDSEENTLTQTSIISKIVEEGDASLRATNNSSHPKEEMDSSHKPLSNIISEAEAEPELCIQKENQIEIIKSQPSTERSKVEDLESTTNVPSKHERTSDKSTLPEILSEKYPEPFNKIKLDVDTRDSPLSNIENDKTTQSEIICERIDESDVMSEKLKYSEGLTLKSNDNSDFKSENIDSIEVENRLIESDVISEKLDPSSDISSRINSEAISEKIDHSEASEKLEQSEIISEKSDIIEFASQRDTEILDQSQSPNEKLDQTDNISENLEQTEVKSNQSVAVSEMLELPESTIGKGSPTENSRKEQSHTISEVIDQSGIIPNNMTSTVKSDISGSENNIQGLTRRKSSAESESGHSFKDSSNISTKVASHISEDLIQENETEKDTSDISHTSKTISENVSSVAEDVTNEAKESVLEESVKEVTYLEVSDHVFQEGSQNSKLDDEVSEHCSEKHIESKSLAEELEEVFDEDTLKDDQPGSSVSEEQEKSTFHSASNADEIFSKDVSGETSDGSFPLPITNQFKKNLIEKKQNGESIIFGNAGSEFNSDIASEKGSLEISEPSEDMIEKIETPIENSEEIVSKVSQKAISVVSEISSEKSNIPSEKSEEIHENASVEIVSSRSSLNSTIIISHNEENKELYNKDAHEIISTASEVPSEKVSIPQDNSEETSVNIESAPNLAESVRTSHVEQPSLIELDSTLEKDVNDAENGSSVKSLNKDLSQSIKSEVNRDLEEDKSFSESEVLHDSDIKSPLEELDLEDSFDGNFSPVSSLKLKSKLYGGQEEYESASEPGEDSFIEEKLSEDDAFGFLTGQDSDQQSPWSQGTDSKTSGAPMIDALQREGESALDVLWRGIAESAIEEGKELVISTYLKRIQPDIVLSAIDSLDGNKLVGDNEEEEWDKEKLPRDQAAEAEILRLQRLRIDKEIEELEEEEARQYYYVRPIPDKPPPPYTPRRSSLVSSVVEAAGELWEGRMEAPPSFMAGSHLRDFIWDLAAELVLQANPPQPPPHPPWVKLRRARPKKPIKSKEDLLVEVEKEAKIYLGVEEREVRENLIIRWSRKRRDHVDEILVRESGEEEWEWTDFTEEENTVKNRIADAIIQESLAEATAALALAFTNKFKPPT